MVKWIIIIAAIISVWWWYERKKVAAITPTNSPGSVPTTSSAWGVATNFSRYGNSSPGSGVPAAQPTLQSTWATAGGYGVGYVASVPAVTGRSGAVPDDTTDM